MSDSSVTAATLPQDPTSRVAPATGGPASRFGELLSELNPLQYIPVIGTIYRSITGDTIPDSVRIAGSFVFSGLTGGPIGLATNAVMLAVEKATGISPEEIGRKVLADIGVGTAPTATANAAPSQSTSDPAATGTPDTSKPTAPGTHAAPSGDPDTKAAAWSTSQLASYGIVRTANGGLRHGDLVGSDVLNDLELARNRNGNDDGTMLAAL